MYSVSRCICGCISVNISVFVFVDIHSFLSFSFNLLKKPKVIHRTFYHDLIKGMVASRAARYWKTNIDIAIFDIAIFFSCNLYCDINETQEKMTLYRKNHSRTRVVHLYRQ